MDEINITLKGNIQDDVDVISQDEIRDLILENSKLKEELRSLHKQINMILNICEYGSKSCATNDCDYMIDEYLIQDSFMDKIVCQFDDGEDKQTKLPCSPFTVITTRSDAK